MSAISRKADTLGEIGLCLHLTPSGPWSGRWNKLQIGARVSVELARWGIDVGPIRFLDRADRLDMPRRVDMELYRHIFKIYVS